MLFVHSLYSYFVFSEIIKEYTLLIYFLGIIRTLGGSDAHEHLGKLGFTLGKAEPPSGATTGGTPYVPKNTTIFRKIFVSKILTFLEKWMQGVSHYGTGPAEPRDRLRLWDTAFPLTTLRLSCL